MKRNATYLLAALALAAGARTPIAEGDPGRPAPPHIKARAPELTGKERRGKGERHRAPKFPRRR